MAEVAERAKQISIHAPTRGATITDAFSLMMELFQSTLLQEERRRIACPADHYSYFNPRSYKRSDLHSALALSKICYFNPRSYKRSDVRPELPEPFPCYFNPRSYKRSDLNLCCIINCYKYFNPRSYKRSDCEETSNSFHDDYFNPRSYKRSDNTSFKKLINSTISIHAPTRGATASVFLASSIRSLFQSTLLQEERLPSRIARTISMLFQSTLLQEERRVSEVQAVVYCIISIHAPTRGATMQDSPKNWT